MITTLLFTTLFLIIWYYLRDLINYYKTGDPNENNQNYWMFSYDFKDEKDFKSYLTFRCINNRTTLDKPNFEHMCSDKFSFESWKNGTV